MLLKASSFTAKANTTYTAGELQTLRGSQLLDSVVMVGVQFTGAVTLNDFCLSDNAELVSLNLSGSEGLGVPPIPIVGAPATTPRPIPTDWALLTKFTTFNLSACGFTAIQLGNLVKDFSTRVNEGLGVAIATGKVLTLNGQNAPLAIADATIAAAKANLVAKGWQVIHN